MAGHLKAFPAPLPCLLQTSVCSDKVAAPVRRAFLMMKPRAEMSWLRLLLLSGVISATSLASGVQLAGASGHLIPPPHMTAGKYLRTPGNGGGPAHDALLAQAPAWPEEQPYDT